MNRILFMVLLSCIFSTATAQDLTKPALLSTSLGSDTDGSSVFLTEDGQHIYVLQSNEIVRHSRNNKTWNASNLNVPKTDGSFDQIVGINSNANRIYLLRKKQRGQSKNTGIYVTNKETNGWSEPALLDVEAMENKFAFDDYFGAHMNQAENVLFTSLDDPRVKGKELLYVSNKLEDGSWTWPRLLADNVNSLNSEISPYLMSDMKTLYFASKGHGGQGGYDILKSSRVDDTWEKWTEPQHVAQFNDESFNGYLMVSNDDSYVYKKEDADGVNRWYFVEKNIPDSDGDGVIDAEDNCPNVAGLAGLSGCPDADGDGVTDSQDNCPNARGTMSTGGCPDADNDGIADANDDCPNSAGTSANGGCPEISREVIETVNTAVRGINFETSSAVIRRASYPNLDQVISVLLNNPSYRVTILGHTDNVGDPASNLRLSQRRAESCANYLMQNGVDMGRIATVGYGDTLPNYDNSTSAGRAENRRVEFELQN